jgi:hypothetical protein
MGCHPGQDTPLRGELKIADLAITRVYKTGTRRKSAIDNRTRHHPGYEIGLRCRKRIEEIFGWTKASAGLIKFKHKGLQKTNAMFSVFAAAHNLVRLPKRLTQQPA